MMAADQSLMISFRSETLSFLDEVERSAGKKFLFRDEVAFLVEASERPRMDRPFADLLFFAKFLSHASTILQRYGTQDQSTAQLSQEFTEKLGKASELIVSLIADASDDMKRQFKERFLSLSRDSMTAMLSLLQQLSWIKNYLLDKERSQ